VRVWTPLADDILLVENSAGESLRVEHLSRGTREQLFLSVRLAIVATFGRRGIKLPLVLDDVLVNFDAVRAKRAAEVLCEFAAGGHQVLLFTCHELLWQMFKQLDADCRRLPGCGGVAAVEPADAIDAIEVAPELVVEAPQVDEMPEPGPVPKKKSRRTSAERKKRKAKSIESPPVEFYEYPFVEKIEVERREPAETVYEWEPQEMPDGSHEPTLAQLIAHDGGVAERGIVDRETPYPDHLEPRRA